MTPRKEIKGLVILSEGWVKFGFILVRKKGRRSCIRLRRKGRPTEKKKVKEGRRKGRKRKEKKRKKKEKKEGKAWFVVFFFVQFPLLVFLNFEEMQCDFSSSFVIMLVDVCSFHHFGSGVFFFFTNCLDGFSFLYFILNRFGLIFYVHCKFGMHVVVV